VRHLALLASTNPHIHQAFSGCPALAGCIAALPPAAAGQLVN